MGPYLWLVSTATYFAALASIQDAQRAQQVASEDHALAGIERSCRGKVERGEYIPTLALIFGITGVLECCTAALMSEALEQHSAGDQRLGRLRREGRRTEPTGFPTKHAATQV